MMKDFVERNRNGFATTEGFMQVAAEHFARTPMAQRYGLKNLDWFTYQWIYGSAMPDYQLDYHMESRPDGGVTLMGTIMQSNVPEDWLMMLPIVAEFSGNRKGRVTIHALGPKTAVEVSFPEKPKKLELDPEMWILSGKTLLKGS